MDVVLRERLGVIDLRAERPHAPDHRAGQAGGRVDLAEGERGVHVLEDHVEDDRDAGLVARVDQ